MLIDFGLLRLWSGRAAPVLDADLVGDKTAAAAQSAQDWEITGPDGAQAAALLDLAVMKGRYAFDVPSGSHVKLMPLRELLNLDDRLEAVLRTPAPAAFERGGPAEDFLDAAPPAPLD